MRKKEKTVGWLIILEMLWAFEDCRRGKIKRIYLWLGFAAGLLAAAGAWKQGDRSAYGMVASLAPGALLLGWSLLKEGQIGRADGYMVAIIGLFVGWERCIFLLAAACLMAAGYGMIGIWGRRLTKGSKLYFAPFLLAASLGLWIVS